MANCDFGNFKDCTCRDCKEIYEIKKQKPEPKKEPKKKIKK